MAAKKTVKKSESPVIVRAYSGVFFGYMTDRRVTAAGVEVDLVRLRQIWQWTSNGMSRPVLTCGDIALRGVGTGSKISDVAPGATVTDVKVHFICTPEAVKVLEELP